MAERHTIGTTDQNRISTSMHPQRDALRKACQRPASGTGRSSRSMPPSSARSRGPANRSRAPTPALARPSRPLPAASVVELTPSSRAALELKQPALPPAPYATPCCRPSAAAPGRCLRRLGPLVRHPRCRRAFAASLLELPPCRDLCDAGAAPDLHQIFAEDRGAPPLLASRLPLRL